MGSSEPAGGSPSDTLVVVVAGTPYHGMRRGSRGLTDALAKHCTVLYVDPPRSLARDPRALTTQGPHRESSSIYRLAPVAAPGMTRPPSRSITRALLVRAIRNAAAEIGGSPPVILQQAARFPVLGRCGEGTSVYYVTDDYAAGAALVGKPKARLERAESEAAAHADLIVAVSDRLAEKWSRLGKPVRVIRNGVDVEAFEAPPAAGDDRIGLDHPIAAIIGTLSERIDLDLVERTLDTGAVSLLLVGEATFRAQQTRFDRLLERPNVQWLGQQDFARLPGIYYDVDVALLPYARSPFNMASNPLKALEYLAAGKPVVATGIPAVVELGAPDVVIADSPEAFAQSVIRTATDRHDPGRVSLRRAFAREHSWGRRAAELADALDLGCWPRPSQ